MKRKILCALLILLALSAGALCHAQSYVNAAGRINFYYQHDGGGRNQPGVWDALLRNRLLAISGHDSIYYNDKTDRFLTGRGCCLFSFAHAYQYLKGYAASSAQKADILYQFLSIKPVWSASGSTLSPPNAHSYYAAYLLKLGGIRQYTGELDTFSRLQSFFEGNRSVIIVNAPGHYIIAVGARRYGGVQYVQVVDSIMSATVRSSRITYGKSMDFSVTYTESNAALYEADVHSYWIPYSQFAAKCKLRYAFYTGSAPRENNFKLIKDKIILPEGQTTNLALQSAADILAYETSDPNVCEVDGLGRLIWMGEGKASVRVYAPDNPQNEAYAEVYCIRPRRDTLVIADAGARTDNPFADISLPHGAKIVYDPFAPQSAGVYKTLYRFVDPDGDTVCEVPVTLAVVEKNGLFILPDGLRLIERGAFDGVPFATLVVPASVTHIESGAFSESGITLVLAACGETAVETGAFPEGARVFYDGEAIQRWRMGN